MGKMRARAARVLIEALENREMMSGNPGTPVTLYRTAPLLAQAGVSASTHISSQSYFNLVRQLADTAPQLAAGADVEGWSADHKTVQLGALGSYAGIGGETALKYTWTAVTVPPGALPQIGANGTNGAKHTAVSFDRAGTYTFNVAISDGKYTVNDTVSFTLDAVATQLVVAPTSPAQLSVNGTQQFTATLLDEFGMAMAGPVAWSVDGGSAGTIAANGIFTAGSQAGQATVRATSGNLTGAAVVVINNGAPTIASPAAAGNATVSGTSTSLSVLGADDGGEKALTYSWSLTSGPAGVSFSSNGTNGARNTAVSFGKAGNYTFQVVVSDGSLTTTSSVTLNVAQTLKTVTVTPDGTSVTLGQSVQFSANGLDQFGNALAVQPAWSWSKVSGGGTVNASGLFTAGTPTGAATVRASASGVSGTASVAIGNAAPTVATAAAASGQTATGINLCVLGADDGGESGLSYLWTVVNAPAGGVASFSINGGNSAKNTSVTFNEAGSYSFLVTISDGAGTTTSSVNVTVGQLLSSIVLTPGTVTIAPNGTQQFAATALDQFGNALATQPGFAWSLAGGAGSIDGSGLYRATIAAAPAAGSSNVIGTGTTLSVLGADDGGENGLTYTWSLSSGPAAVTFSSNGVNGSKNTAVSFSKAGTYTFAVVVSDGSLTTAGSVTLQVAQTLTSITAAAASGSINLNQSTLFTATGFDQFGDVLTVQPAFSWTKVSGVGTINSAGLFSAGAAGSAVVKASAAGVNGTAGVSVINAAPAVAVAAAAGNGNVTGNGTTLSVLGADDGGEAGLTYSWSTLSAPAGATPIFGGNGSNGAKNTSVTFNRAGNYTFRVTISDGSLTTSGQVSLVVSQTVSTVAVTPGNKALTGGATQQFAATVSDQFGQAIASAVSWSIDGGGAGVIDANGLFTAGSSTGNATVRASAGGVSGTASVSVTAAVVPPNTGVPATVSTRQMTSFTELVITGTSGNDSIYVSQSGNSFTIVSNGNTQTINGTFGDLVVHAGNGGATITVDSSVTINTLVYGGAGNDTLVNKASAGYTAIVSIGGGNDVVTGNGSSTSYWADTTDGVNSSAAESTGGYVHKISQFYQPWTTNSSSADYVSTQLGGQNLRDPGDIGSPIHYSSNSLFGTGATAADVNQWQISDCYLLADLAGVANGTPAKLYRTVIDLGDGTYGVQFTRNGVSSVVRVDGDFGAMQAHVGNSGNLWSLVVEKAYAYYRFGSNTYSSLNYGSTVAVDQDLGISVGVSFTSRGAARLYSDVTGILAGGGMATVETASILAGAPLIGNHAYSIAGAYQQNGVYYFVLRNPWGFDGTGSDSNPGDGLVTLTFDQIQANFSAVYLGTIKT
jgi:hypothetical protein